MRMTNLVWGLALAVGLGFAAPAVTFAQDSAAEKAFDETLLEVKDGETAEAYSKALQNVSQAFSEWAKTAEKSEVEALQPKYQATVSLLEKKIALAEDGGPDAFNTFRSYTIKIAREGKLDELIDIQKGETSRAKPDDNRLGWMDYLVTAVSLDKASEKGGEAFQKAIADLEKRAAEKDKFALLRLSEYVGMVANADEETGAALNNRLIETLSKLEGTEQTVKELKESEVALIGQEVKIEGLYTDKTELNWEDYKGKYVLVDFWATWCGWCIKEIPNNLEQYKKYHEAGFEILGISADDDLDALEKFEAENKHPWKSLSTKITNGAQKADGSKYANLEKTFHVSGYPTMVLIGPDGKIVSMNARGEHLNALLKKFFPDVK